MVRNSFSEITIHYRQIFHSIQLLLKILWDFADYTFIRESNTQSRDKYHGSGTFTQEISNNQKSTGG